MTSRDLWRNAEAAFLRRGVKRVEIAAAMKISERTLTNRRKHPDTATLGEIEKAFKRFKIPMWELTRED